MALGARPADVLRLVAMESVGLSFIAIGAGLAGAWALTRYLKSILYGITPLDAPSFSLAPVILLGRCARGDDRPGPPGREGRPDPVAGIMSNPSTRFLQRCAQTAPSRRGSGPGGKYTTDAHYLNLIGTARLSRDYGLGWHPVSPNGSSPTRTMARQAFGKRIPASVTLSRNPSHRIRASVICAHAICCAPLSNNRLRRIPKVPFTFAFQYDCCRITEWLSTLAATFSFGFALTLMFCNVRDDKPKLLCAQSL